MADIFDNLSNLTLNIQEATQDSDLIKVNPYFAPELTEIHGVLTGYVMDRYIPILGRLGDIGRIDPGTCGVNTYTGAFPVSQKTATPKLISERIPICADEVPRNLKFWMEQQIASKRWENISSPLKQYVLDLIQESVTRAIIRIAEEADTTADNVADGGYLSAGIDPTLFTMLDGMWKQIFTDGALATPLIYRATIDENNEGTKALQKALASDRAYKILCELTENLPAEAMMNNKNEIQLSPSLWYNWVRYHEEKSGAFNPEFLFNGLTNKNFNGFPIRVRWDWDRINKLYYDQGDTYYLPHRAIIQDKNNCPVITSDTQSFSALDVFYEKKDKKLYADVAFRVDCKILQENSLAVAY